VIRYDNESVADRVKEITNGAGVSVVYDAVGKTTFNDSLDCLAPLGMLVSFGQSSGPVPPFDISILSQKGSLFLTRPTLMTYTAKREDLVASAKALFDIVGSGVVKIEVNQRFALRDAAEAHKALEQRQTTGSTILQP
jgi:NADPH2:quinone reductase